MFSNSQIIDLLVKYSLKYDKHYKQQTSWAIVFGLLVNVNLVAAFQNSSFISHDPQTGSLVCSKDLKKFQLQ